MFRIDIEDDRVRERERKKNINDFPKNCVISWRIFVWCTWNLQAVNFKKRFRSIWKKKKTQQNFLNKKNCTKNIRLCVCVTKKNRHLIFFDFIDFHFTINSEKNFKTWIPFLVFGFVMMWTVKTKILVDFQQQYIIGTLFISLCSVTTLFIYFYSCFWNFSFTTWQEYISYIVNYVYVILFCFSDFDHIHWKKFYANICSQWQYTSVALFSYENFKIFSWIIRQQQQKFHFFHCHLYSLFLFYMLIDLLW